jgi:malate permease and related proteins
VRVSLPALILSVVPGLPLGADLLVPVAVAWGTLGVTAAAIVLVARLLRWDPVTRATLLVVVPLGNTSFLGFPAIEALLGPEALGPAVVYDQLGSFLALSTYASVLAIRAGRAPLVGRPRPAWARMLAFPPFVALLVAVLVRPVGLPDAVQAVAEILGATVTPLAMLAIGLRLELRSALRRPAPLAAGLLLRMVLAPALVLGAAAALGGSGLVWDVSVLQAAMPPMVTAAVLAAQAGLDAKLASALAGVGVLVAMATLPAWAWLLGGT